MALAIASQAPSYDAAYATEDFMVLLESHLSYFKGLPDVVVKTVTAQEGAKYRGDFFGLLTFMQVPQNAQYLTLRMNNYSDPVEYQGDLLDILIPPQTKLGLLKNMSTTTTKKST